MNLDMVFACRADAVMRVERMQASVNLEPPIAKLP